MRLLIAGLKKAELISWVQKILPDFQIVENHPEMVLVYGGDGTLLYAERVYPGVPKVFLRSSQLCKSCLEQSKQDILQLLQQKKYQLVKALKLQAQFKNKTLLALNEIMVRHEHYNKALRYKIYLNGKQYLGEFLGDGPVIATPLGSTGYFQSITRKNFSQGLGIAFNNNIIAVQPVILPEQTEIRVEITRGPGVLIDDNNEIYQTVLAGDKIEITPALAKAKFVIFKGIFSKYNFTQPEQRAPLGCCQACHKII